MRIHRKLAKMVEGEKAHQLLTGLNNDLSYRELNSGTRTFTIIFNMVSQDEAHKNVMISRDEQDVAM